MHYRRKPLGACLVLTLALAACTSSGQDELQAWMLSERNSIKPSVQPIPEPTRFVPQAYGGERLTPPFSTEKLASVLRGSQVAPVANAALIEPELNRRKQPLEAYPLDTMSMVGSLNREGQLVALVKVDKLLYQVRPGNYLGQNFGRVTRITETEVVMREIVQDSAGEWTERAAALQLQEDASK
ncbi:MAG: pilus assembly protein PilP [Hydrogenophaga sp.]|jgi:type IV pilus assembly protein PilP|uniref:pilus assembly protein PilP n=1 Tax=Hydrogenophaga sp. TaxID=1904254 RepID=UPI002696EA7E|nr:pilus assembly protein PilP [Hydrogenophaga sp.]MDP3833613.1 pilus assembly protein PilP [Hydrogenophaga sp.]MDZ4397302.1 pilus assembly protein PilP [Hydrogenophaga sp.]